MGFTLARMCFQGTFGFQSPWTQRFGFQNWIKRFWDTLMIWNLFLLEIITFFRGDFTDVSAITESPYPSRKPSRIDVSLRWGSNQFRSRIFLVLSSVPQTRYHWYLLTEGSMIFQGAPKLWSRFQNQIKRFLDSWSPKLFAYTIKLTAFPGWPNQYICLILYSCCWHTATSAQSPFKRDFLTKDKWITFQFLVK